MDAPSHEESPSQALWRAHYQWREPGKAPEPSIEASWDRVALAVSAPELQQRDVWCQRFRSILQDFSFLPSNQVLSRAGTGLPANLSNCHALAPREDSVSGVFEALHESAIALQAGVGIGLDFSHLHPRGAYTAIGNRPHAGALSYMPLWRETAEILLGAQGDPDNASIGLRCDHPDMEDYVDAYAEHHLHPQVHRVVFVSDAWMEAIDKGADWPLLYPLTRQTLAAPAELCERVWAGDTKPQPCLVYKRLAATSLWTRLLQDEYAHASPRLVFMDQMQRTNNLWYAEQISVNSPCSSVPLPAGGACNRGSINLTRCVLAPFSKHPDVDWDKLRMLTGFAIRFLDNVYDISAYPFTTLSSAAHATRRLGLGITGLHSMFNMLGLDYSSQSSLDLANQLMQVIRDTAYQASMEIAREKGAFPAFNRAQHAVSPMVLKLPPEIQNAIASHGIRNSHLLAVASDPRLDRLAHDVSHGIEPLVAAKSPLPLAQERLVPSPAVGAEAQLAMASVVQFHVDNAVAVNIHVPAATSSMEVGGILRRAWQLKLKNCRVARAVPRAGETGL